MIRYRLTNFYRFTVWSAGRAWRLEHYLPILLVMERIVSSHGEVPPFCFFQHKAVIGFSLKDQTSVTQCNWVTRYTKQVDHEFIPTKPNPVCFGSNHAPHLLMQLKLQPHVSRLMTAFTLRCLCVLRRIQTTKFINKRFYFSMEVGVRLVGILLRFLNFILTPLFWLKSHKRTCVPPITEPMLFKGAADLAREIRNGEVRHIYELKIEFVKLPCTSTKLRRLGTSYGYQLWVLMSYVWLRMLSDAGLLTNLYNVVNIGSHLNSLPD